MQPTSSGNIIGVALLSFILTAGCECERKKPDKVNTVAETVDVRQLATATGVNEALRILYVDAAAIDSLQGKLIFRFYVDSENDLVVNGWRDNFDKTPAVVFPKTTRLSNVKISANTYLGNIYLNANALNDIQRKLGNGSGEFAYLKLIPMIDTRAGSAGQIIYKVVYTNTSPFYKTAMLRNDSLLNIYDSTVAPVAPGDEDSGFMLNPSPPRKESDQ